MRFYVGRWNLLPKEFLGLGRLTEKEIISELSREIEEWGGEHKTEDNLMGVYTADEFVETFNSDEWGDFCGATYWLRTF